MDTHSDEEPATPALTYSNGSYWKTEDSGYHTSITPGSEISNENLDPSLKKRIRISGRTRVNCDITPEPTFRPGRKYLRPKNVLSSTLNESASESPNTRRGVKRPYHDSDEFISPVPTPTTTIAGGIQKLKVTDIHTPSQTSFSLLSVNSEHETVSCDLYHLNESVHALSYPTTPVKKICKTSCKPSPGKRSAKKLNFTIHSLSCESHAVIKNRSHSKVVKTIQFRPEQKIDIIEMLFKVAGAMPPIHKILSYLSFEDIYNFSLVSPLWCDVWNQVSKAKMQEFKIFMKNAKENQENLNKGLTPKNSEANQIRSLKEVHNVLNTHVVSDPPRSPPGTPRTNKFKRFTKSASLDSRIQLSCVRCRQPAKVTEETSGEQWAECTSNTCSYQFCRYCKCNRHPGTNCFKYDLDGPSPSKRKKNLCAVGTKKSKRNLRRLL